MPVFFLLLGDTDYCSVALRASMSASLRENLGSSSVDVSLAQLEAQAQNMQASEESVSCGPFGVLNMDTVPSEANQTIYTSSDTTSNQGQLTELNSEDSLLGATSCSATLYASIPNLSKTLQWSDLFTLGLNSGHSLRSPQHATAIPQQRPGNLMLGNELTQDGNVANWLSMCSTQEPDEMRLPEISTLVAGPGRQMIALVEVDSVAEAQLLLKHFHDSVVSLMTPIPPKAKNYWIDLQLAEAVRVLSELSYLRTGNISHASAANLYGILACSAYYLSNVHVVQTTKEPEYWMNLFTRLKHQASVHMQVSVHEEQDYPRKASYKAQLMAFLTLVACNVSQYLHVKNAKC
jgi:arginine metabolism regulation protein II